MWTRRWLVRLLRASVVLSLLLAAVLLAWGVPAPPSYRVEAMPRIGWRHAWRSLDIVRRYAAYRRFAAWRGHDAGMLVVAGTTNRFLRVDEPGEATDDGVGVPDGAFGMQWSRDIERPWLVYTLDTGGSELYRFYRYDMDTGASTRLTETAARAYAGGLAPDGRHLALTRNERNGIDSDVYVMDVTDPSSRRRVYDGGDLWLSGWTTDGRLLVNQHVGIERSRSFLVDPESGAATPVFEEVEGGSVIRSVTRARTGPTMCIAADFGGEFVGLHAFDPTSDAITPLAPDLRWDIQSIEAMADGRTLALIVNEDSAHVPYLFDLPSGTARPLTDWPGGFVTRLSAHPTLPRLALDVVDLAGVPGVWIYDLEARRLTPWSVESASRAVTPPEVVHVPTFDLKPDGTRRHISAIVFRPEEPLAEPHPVLIDIHGGPTGQATTRVLPRDALPGPRPVTIRPNVRGLTGYGRAFEQLDDGVLREDAVRDIGALLDWIDGQPDFDGSRVAVMGGLYGGFMALASLIRYDGRFRCGVDMFGIADLPRAIEESDQGHFGDAQRGEYGDPADPAVRAFLTALSPVTSADRIGVPLLVYQGGNDIRVKPGQSRLLVDRVRQAGGSVTYLEVPGEGHGLVRPMTQFYFGVAMLEFLGRCL